MKNDTNQDSTTVSFNMSEEEPAKEKVTFIKSGLIFLNMFISKIEIFVLLFFLKVAETFSDRRPESTHITEYKTSNVSFISNKIIDKMI